MELAMTDLVSPGEHPPGERGFHSPGGRFILVIPAAVSGNPDSQPIDEKLTRWIPAFASMTKNHIVPA